MNNKVNAILNIKQTINSNINRNHLQKNEEDKYVYKFSSKPFTSKEDILKEKKIIYFKKYEIEVPEEYQGEKRLDYFYENLMKEILAWDEEIYRIGSVTDFNTYIKLITKYQDDLGYSNWSDIYTDNFYNILIHGYYNDNKCPNHYDTPLAENIKEALKTHAHKLFSNKYQDKYKLTRVMFKFVLLVCQYKHHEINMESLIEKQKENNITFYNNQKSQSIKYETLQNHIKNIIKICGGTDYIEKEIHTNGFNRNTFEHLLVMQKYPEQYVYNFKLYKPTIEKSYIEEFLKMLGNTKEDISSFIYGIH